MGFLSTTCSEGGDGATCVDRELVARCQDGDREAFRSLVLNYQDQVYRIVLRQVRDESIAREIAQETFLRVFKHIKTFRSDSSFRTWLLRIAMNCVRTHFSSRSHREKTRTTALDEEKEEILIESDTLDVSAMNDLAAAISELPSELREIIVLCGVEQYTYEEVAAILEIPLGTVRSRLHRARLRLRDLYFDEGGSGE